jgi:hypothetical protein
MEWKPETIESVKKIVQDGLAKCNHNQTTVFETYRVEPHIASIVRSGTIESVVVVAHKGNQVIYWEDVEEGFGVSAVATDGPILEHDCNQNDLGLALNSWIE